MKSKMLRMFWVAVLSCCSLAFCSPIFSPRALAQGTAADYERANSLKAKYEAAAIDISGAATWIGNTHRFWYRKLSRGGKPDCRRDPGLGTLGIGSLQ